MDKAERWFREAQRLLHGGDAAGAERLARKVLRQNPRHPGALALTGRTQALRGNHEAAVERLSRAWEALPDDPDIPYDLGLSLLKLYRCDEAADRFRDAIRLGPKRAWTHRMLGHALWYLWDWAGTREQFEAAHRLEPDDPTNIHNILFSACYDPTLSPAALGALHAEWGARYAARAWRGAPEPHPNPPDPERVLKVGYLSPDFKRHPVSAFLGAIVAYHHPGAVSTYFYANVRKPDDVTRAFRQVCPNWRDVTGMDDAALAEQVRADGIDVLVELAGYTKDTRVAVLARRPAPVQVSYLGYPATTGLKVMDWRVTDQVADPPGTEPFYTERLARVEGGFCCFMPPPDAPPPNPLPALANGHLTFGSFVNIMKVNPSTIALWCRALAAIPDSRMLLFRHSLASPAMRERYLAEFERHGIGRERVDLAWELPPLSEGGYLGVYHRADVVLDTLPFNGHTSTCEALWMGVPVLTLTGPQFAGRLSAAVLQMAGLGGLAAATPEAFVQAAVRLAKDLNGLAGLRQGLRAHLGRTRLLNAEATTRALEATYRALWRDWCAGRGGRG